MTESTALGAAVELVAGVLSEHREFAAIRDDGSLDPESVCDSPYCNEPWPCLPYQLATTFAALLKQIGGVALLRDGLDIIDVSEARGLYAAIGEFHRPHLEQDGSLWIDHDPDGESSSGVTSAFPAWADGWGAFFVYAAANFGAMLDELVTLRVAGPVNPS